MHKPMFKQRLQYFFDNFMARGTPALILALFIISAIIILLAAALVWITGSAPENLSFWEIAWMGLLRTLDSGTMGNAQRVRLVAPSDLVIALTFEARVAGQSGPFALCLPMRAVRKMVDKLLDAEHRGAEDVASRREGPAASAAELAVYLNAKELSSDELLRLQVGHLVLTDAAADTTFTVTLDGQPSFQGRAGAVHGRRAIGLEQLSAVEEDEE